MSFLNPLILLAALGIALPILAHLLNRQQVKRTDWAAMQFLNRNLRVRSRQIRLRDILLLLLRCLALLLLVLALSRPFWPGTSGNWLSGEARAGVVIAIDSSFSMGHTEDGISRFDRALEQARIIAKSIQHGDPVSLVLMGGEDEVIIRNMAFDPVRFNKSLKEAKTSSATLDLDRVAKRISELVEDMDAPQKEAYFITDTQSIDWRNASLNLQSAFSDLQEKGKVFLIPVTGTGNNLAVEELSLISGVLRKGTTARYQATIHNYGSQPATNLEVRCLVNGLQIDSKTIPLIQADSSETVSLFVPFHNSGPARITAEITDDFLPADNFRNIVSVIRERVSVLCVDGSNGVAGNLLVSALLARSDGSQNEDYSVRSIPWISLPSEQLDNIDVIILADVPEITEEQVERLSHFVAGKWSGLVWRRQCENHTLERAHVKSTYSSSHPEHWVRELTLETHLQLAVLLTTKCPFMEFAFHYARYPMTSLARLFLKTLGHKAFSFQFNHSKSCRKRCSHTLGAFTWPRTCFHVYHLG